MKQTLLLVLAILAVSCHPAPKPDAGPTDAVVVAQDAVGTSDGAAVDASMADAAMMKSGPPAPRLTIKNSCSYGIWVQQQNLTGAPEVVAIPAGGMTSYNIPAAGLAATRFWPKTGCDATGNNCAMGQSSPPCPTGGCPPPVDSKIEATWGCLFSDPSKCAKNPSNGQPLDMTTWWNASAVDGYTLSYTISVSGGDGRQACAPVDCSGLTAAGCPTDDNLSTNNQFPQYMHQNERVKNQRFSFIGCYSTCDKLTYPTFGGNGIQPPSAPSAQMYCCPTPPVSAAQCTAGPVVKTKYVEAIHTMCKKTVYGYAYDDGVGLRNCSSDTTITMTFGPNCP